MFDAPNTRLEMVRLGEDSHRQLAPELPAPLFQERSRSGRIRFDEQELGGATLDDLDRLRFEVQASHVAAIVIGNKR